MTAPSRARRTYLEMRAPEALRPAAAPAGQPLVVAREWPCSAERYRSLYLGVGEAHHWVDRAAWTDVEIRAHVTLPGIEIWLGWVGTDIAGFFELRDWPDGSTEIAYFGLLPAFLGRGLGGSLLTEAVRTAWAKAPEPGLAAHIVARPPGGAGQLQGARLHGDAGGGVPTLGAGGWGLGTGACQELMSRCHAVTPSTP